MMRKLLLVATLLLAPSAAYAQSCTGQFAAGQVCGNPNATQGIPQAGLLSPLLDRNFGAPSAKGTVLNRGTSAWSATINPVLGNPGTTTGTLGLGSTSGGTATLTPPAIAGNTALQLPSLGGTVPSTAVSPITLDATTGALGCSTCVTGTAGALVINLTGVSGASAGQALYSDGAKLQAYNVSQSASASSLVQRDANQNAFFNNYFANAASTVSAGGTTVLTAASARYQALTGSSSQTYQLPNATTLTIGPAFVFNNNSSGSLIITNAGGTTLYTTPAGGLVQLGPTDVSTSNGTWDIHPYPPGTVTWGSGTTGLVMNSALSTTAMVGAGASSSTVPVFIPQRGTSTTGLGGDSTHLYGIVSGSPAWTSTTAGTSIPNLTATGSFTATGLVTNADLANSATTVNGQTCTLGSSCTVTAVASSIVVGTTTVGSGTTTRILYDNAGVLGEYTITGSGTVVAMANSPSFTTPILGVATATTINKVTLTTPATGATLTLSDGKTLTVNNSITLAGTDGTIWTGPSTNATLAALNIADQTVTGGANVTSQSQSTGNITVDCGSRPLQFITNGGAFTITAPSSDGSCVLLTTNNASAGAITFSGFSVGSNTGDALTTTNGSKFMIFMYRINGSSTYAVKALQ